MELGLFEEVADVVRTLMPDELGAPRVRAHRRGIKVWFGPVDVPREHYEAQQLPRRHVDGRDGLALEIGFHAEHRDVDDNDEVVDRLAGAEARWRPDLGSEAEVGEFFGAAHWRRVSEAWIEPDLDDPELAFEVASRLVDYVSALEPIRAQA